MTYQGTVQNGVIVLADGLALPEGMVVQIAPQPKETPPADAAPSKNIWQKLVDLAEEVEKLPCDLPEDYAENHDHYLYGLPKR